MFIVS